MVGYLASAVLARAAVHLQEVVVVLLVLAPYAGVLSAGTGLPTLA